MTRPRKRAEVGIAVEVATDVAKAAASLVLTNPGLTDIVAAVETSRRIYQRMLTYTLNKIIKTVEIRTLSEQRRNGCSRLHGARKKFWLNEGVAST